jgi:hypothetical protein
MKLRLSTLLLLAVFLSACSSAVQDVNFCRVIASAPEFENRTFRTEIIAVASQHGTFAVGLQCPLFPATGLTPVIHFTPSSFEGSLALQKLNDEMEKAWRARNGPLPWKAVAARVTARIEAYSPPQDRYLLRVLDVSDMRLVDIPNDVIAPPPASQEVGAAQ